MFENFGDYELASRLKNIEQRVLTSGWLPCCLLTEELECDDCPLTDCVPCPVNGDGDYRSYLLWLHDHHVAYQRVRQKRIEVLKTILEKHRLPLHWEVLAELAIRMVPGLFDSPQSVKGLLFSNPDIFRMESDGVFDLVAQP